MTYHDVVIAQSDCIVAEHLAAQLHAYFRNVSVARDLDEMRHIIYRKGADIVVLDLDLAAMDELKELTREFSHIAFVCTHRVPDEEMWRTTLESGALDCCPCDDVQEIVRAAQRARRSLSAAA